MNISILFGSGVSFRTGLKNVNEITTEVLEGNWHDHSDNTYYKGLHPTEGNRPNNKVPHIQRFLSYLKTVADQYFASHDRSEANYEDLYYLCEQISNDLKMEFDNPAINPFISQVVSELSGNGYQDLTSSYNSSKATRYADEA